MQIREQIESYRGANVKSKETLLIYRPALRYYHEKDATFAMRKGEGNTTIFQGNFVMTCST